MNFDSFEFDAHNFISNVDNKLNDLLNMNDLQNGTQNTISPQQNDRSHLIQPQILSESQSTANFDSP
jgi:hypothetical protein